MVKLEWGNFPKLEFKNERELYRTIGQLSNTEAFTISFEHNKETGSFSDAYRARILTKANKENITSALRKKITTGNRINCNEFILYLLNEHGFLMSGNAIVRYLDNVFTTIPPEYQNDFMAGYYEICNSDEKKVVYITEYIDINDVTLNLTDIPQKAQSKSLPKEKKIGKRDYLQQAIRDFETGEAGERIVFEQQRKKLDAAFNEGLISKSDLANLDWVSRNDDSLGYDILSFDIEKKIPIFIEVKTTTGGQYTPFYMSENEIEASGKYAKQYRLYRLYNLKKNKVKTVNYYIVEGDISKNEDVVLEKLRETKVYPNKH